MFVIIQFPISDLRRFVTYDTGKLSKPSWPQPFPQEEFIRSFGGINNRHLGGISDWIGEFYVCDAKNAIKFPEIQKPFTLSTSTQLINIVFRRFFYDGLTTGKLEIGFTIKEERKENDSSHFTYYQKEFGILMNKLLNLDTIIPINPFPQQHSKLISSGKFIAKKFLFASTSISFPINNIDNWLVKHHKPIIYIECYQKEIINNPFQSSFLKGNNKIAKVSFSLIPNYGTKYPLMLIHPHLQQKNCNMNIYKDDIRKIRLLLLRLHAEKESLKYTLDCINRNLIDIHDNPFISNQVQDFLNISTRRLLKINSLAKKVFDTNELPQFFYIDELLNKDYCDHLLSELEGIRKNIFNKVETFINYGRVEMGDKYNVGAAGAVGPNSKNVVTTKKWNQNYINENINFHKLKSEILLIRKGLKDNSIDTEGANLEESLKSLETAAENKNRVKIVEILTKVGKQLLVIAEKVGASVLSSLIIELLNNNNTSL